MMPIPKSVLCHSAVLTLEYDPDPWGNPTGAESSPIEFVRLEPVTKHVPTINSNEPAITARLFFDAKNSKCGLPFPDVGDEYNGRKIKARSVVFDGHTYNIQTVKRYYDNVKLHHLEVELSG